MNLGYECLSELEAAIGYNFSDKELLMTALTHSSFANELKINKCEYNERLEFLGDAVLEIVVSEFLYFNEPDVNEGSLSKHRASLVCEKALAECARRIELGKYLRLGKGETLCGGASRDSIISDAMEAVIGAVYLDGGLEEAKKLINAYVLFDLDKRDLYKDCKSALQELCQARFSDRAYYDLLGEAGPEHDRTFKVRARCGEMVLAEGEGRTKKAAEQLAASRSIEMIKSMSIVASRG